MTRRLLLLSAAALASCATARASRCPADDRIVATTADGPVTEADLNRAIAGKPKVAEQIYSIRRDALEGMILERLIEQEAARRKVTPEQLVTSATVAKAPTAAEIQAFFDHELADSGYKLADVKDQIEKHLVSQRRKVALVAFLDRLKSEGRVRILLSAPRVEVRVSGPARGGARARVTINEFSDFQCPYCQAQEEALHRILAAYPDDVRLVFHDFPLDIHPDAARAARAGVCADEQGKFWPMHDALFAHAHALSAADLGRYARELGLDGGKFDACLGSDRAKRRVEASEQEGERDGVEGTPALIVNGRLLAGATSYEDLKAAVDEELSRKGK